MESESEKVKTEEGVQRRQHPDHGALATISLTLGVISLMVAWLPIGFLVGIFAVVISRIALWKIKRGRAGGRKKAIWGLATGYLGTMLATYAFAAFLKFDSQESARKISCVGNLTQISLALRMYSNVYNGEFPPYDGAKGLNVLVQDGFLVNRDIYRCPSVKHKGPYTVAVAKLTETDCDYRYFGGHEKSDPIDTIIACDKPNNHDKFGHVLFLDGHVKGYSGADWLDQAKKAAY